MSGIEFNRRFVLRAGGALVIGFPLAGGALAQGGVNAIADNAQRGAAAGPPDAEQIDTWIPILSRSFGFHSSRTHDVYGEGLE